MTSRWRHCHGNFTLVHTIYICSAFFHCEQVAIRWIILFSASGIHAPLSPWERSACYLIQCSFSYIPTKKRHFRRFFDRLYDTLDMSVWIEKLTNRWPPIKKSTNQNSAYCMMSDHSSDDLYFENASSEPRRIPSIPRILVTDSKLGDCGSHGRFGYFIIT